MCKKRDRRTTIKYLRQKINFHIKYLKINFIFLPHKEVDEEEQWVQTTIMLDFHIKYLEIKFNCNPQRKEK